MAIDDSAFQNCTDLISVTFPASLKLIGKDAFKGCKKLEVATFNAGIEEIDDGAFGGCSLSSVSLPSSIRRIGDLAFWGTNQRDAYHEWGSISDVVIDSATNLTIGAMAFYGNKVNKVWISGKDVVIGRSAFKQSMYVGYEGYTYYDSYNYDIRLRGENIQVREYAFSGLQHRQGPSGVLDLTGVSSLGDCSFESYGLYFRESDDSWYEYGDARPMFSSQLKHADTNAFYRACVGFVKCASLSDVFNVDTMLGFVGRPFGCYYHGLEVADVRVNEIVIPATRDSVPDYAFAYTHLDKITAPDGVRRIGASAFNDCKASEINVADSVVEIGPYAFSDNEISCFTWPSSAADIPERAFSGCSKLADMTIPEGVISIGSYAFNGTALASVTLPSTLKLIGGNAFSQNKLTELAIPEGVTNVGYYAFSGCSALMRVSLPTSLERLGSGAFYNCYKLKDIYIPDLAAWSRVDVDASYSSSMHPFSRTQTFCVQGQPVNDLVIPEGVTKIGMYAFAYCTNIVSVKIPSSVREIGKGAFEGCTKIESFKVADDNPCFESIDGILYEKKSVTPLYVPATTGRLQIREGVEIVNASVVKGLSSLTNVVIPASVTSVVASAFSNCRNNLRIELSLDNKSYLMEDGILYTADGKTLVMANGDVTNIVFRSTVETIGEYAFQGCGSLLAIVIPDTVTDIGYYVIQGCSSLKKLVVSKSLQQMRPLCYGSDCPSLEEVVLPFAGEKRGLVSWSSGNLIDRAIGSATASRLKKLTITDDTEFAKGALSSCTSLEELTLPFVGAKPDSTTDTYFGYIFGAASYEKNEDKVPASLKKVSVCVDGNVAIGNYAFYGCSTLEHVSLDGVETVGYMAFYKCSKLEKVELSDGVRTISNYAFCACRALRDVLIPESVVSIGYSAFEGTSLSSTNRCLFASGCLLGPGAAGVYYSHGDNRLKEIPEGTRLIANSCFRSDKTLIDLVLPPSVRFVNGYAFAGSSVTNVVVQGRDISFESAAFYAESSKPLIKRVAVGSMADWCSLRFANISANPLCCGKAEFVVGGQPVRMGITLPDGVEQVNSHAFYQLPKVETVEFAASVTNICNDAFDGCPAITSMRFRSMTAPAMEKDAFLSVGTNCTVFVPRGSTGWNAFNSCRTKIPAGTGAYWITTVPRRFNLVEYGDPCKVRLDVNGGESSVDAVSLNENINYGELPTPVRTGYRFDGWYTSAEGGEKILTSTAVSGDSQLYAHWTSEVPVITNLDVVAIECPTKVTVRYALCECVSTDDYGLKAFAVVDGVTNFFGEAEGDVSLTAGEHVMTVDLAPFTDSIVDKVIIVSVSVAARSDYCVIDLSKGSAATRYPLQFFSENPATSWSDEYKTSKIVLKRVYPGTFLMGSPSSETGRTAASEYRHQVTLTKGYYLGVFEITQRQWELVMGANPSTGYYISGTRPVESVSWNMVRGSCLESEDSFLGRLRKKTGLNLELPMEAQWEYACRAGTTTALYNGKDLGSTTTDSNLGTIARYYGSKGIYTSPVGTYAANDWGFYDMLGNVGEMCRDGYVANLGTTSVTDPFREFSSSSMHAVRGGTCLSYAKDCRSAFRATSVSASNKSSSYAGVRISLDITPSSLTDTSAERLLNGREVSVSVSSCRVAFELGYEGKRLTVDCYDGLPLDELPESPERAGYDFLGWFTDVEGGEEVVSGRIVHADEVFHAHWKARMYEIMYVDTKDCAHTNPTNYTIESDEIVFAQLTAPAGWKFLGWSPAKIEKGSTGDVTATAQWEQIKYAVDVDGIAVSAELGGCTNGQQVTVATFAEKTEGLTNVVCRGWVGTGDVPATGVGTQVTFTVTQASSLKWVYQTNYWVSVSAREGTSGTGTRGGLVVLKDAAGLVVSNELWAAVRTNLTAEATAAEGLLFAGWQTVDGVSTSEVLPFTVDAPVFLEAVFTQKVFAVTFDLGDHGTRSGGGALAQSVAWGGAAVTPEVTANEGWMFSGWDVAFDHMESNLTVTARWTPVDSSDFLIRSVRGVYAVTSSVDVAINGTSKTDLLVCVPYPENSAYQGIAWMSEIDEDLIATFPETDDKLIRYARFDSSLQSVSIRREFVFTNWSVVANLDMVTNSYPYDTSSDLYRTYTRVPTGANLQINPTNEWILARRGEILDEVGDDAYLAYARAAYALVASQFSYRLDEPDLETVVANRGGQCGGLTAVVVSLLRANGIPSRPLVGVRPDGTYHVWGEFYLQGYGWVPFDVTQDLGKSTDFGHFGLYDDSCIVMSRDMHQSVTSAGGRVCDVKLLQKYAFWWWYDGSPVEVSISFALHGDPVKYAVDVDGVIDDTCVYGQSVTAATFAEKTEGYTNVVCLGWIGMGDVPATGVGTQVTFTVTQASSLKWVYQTNYWVSVDAESSPRQGGTVVLYDAERLRVHSNSGWFAAGSNLTAEATANEGWLFAGWRIVDAESSPRQEGEGDPSIGRGEDAASTNAVLPFVVDAPVFLDAVFTQKVFTVAFNLGEHGTRSGGGALEQTIVYGMAADAPMVSAASGYILTGWDRSFNAVTESMTVKAVYETIVYTITYAETKDVENSNPTSYTVESEEIVFTPLTAPAGWRFLGWSPAKIEKGSTGDVTVTAQWEQIKYAVDVDGVAVSVEQGGCTNGQQVTVATFAEKTEGLTNIVCLGWVGSGDVPATGVGTQVTFTVTQASSLKWVYQTNYWVQVEVEKVGGGGEIGGSVVLKGAAGVVITNELWAAVGTNLTAEATATEGWLFAEWRTVDTNGIVSTNRKLHFRVTAPVFLWAEFVENAYAVRFDTTGGTGEMDRQILTYGNVYKLPSCTATPPADKTRFAGWACSNGKRYDDGCLVFNLAKPGETVTMTAIWE